MKVSEKVEVRAKSINEKKKKKETARENSFELKCKLSIRAMVDEKIQRRSNNQRGENAREEGRNGTNRKFRKIRIDV